MSLPELDFLSTERNFTQIFSMIWLGFGHCLKPYTCAMAMVRMTSSAGWNTLNLGRTLYNIIFCIATNLDLAMSIFKHWLVSWHLVTDEDSLVMKFLLKWGWEIQILNSWEWFPVLLLQTEETEEESSPAFSSTALNYFLGKHSFQTKYIFISICFPPPSLLLSFLL